MNLVQPAIWVTLWLSWPFLAAIGFVVGEYFYDQMSSIKSRRHFLWADIGFSGLWSFFFLLAFCVMTHQWTTGEEPPAGYGHSNIRAAIFFSFLSIFFWGASSFLSFQRYKAGFDSAFGGGIDEAALAGGDQPQGQGGYQAYQEPGGYSEPPFSQQGSGSGGYESVQY